MYGILIGPLQHPQLFYCNENYQRPVIKIHQFPRRTKTQSNNKTNQKPLKVTNETIPFQKQPPNTNNNHLDINDKQ